MKFSPLLAPVFIYMTTSGAATDKHFDKIIFILQLDYVFSSVTPIHWTENVFILMKFHHFLHRKLLTWQLLVQSWNISSKWWQFGILSPTDTPSCLPQSSPCSSCASRMRWSWSATNQCQITTTSRKRKSTGIPLPTVCRTSTSTPWCTTWRKQYLGSSTSATSHSTVRNTRAQW